MLPMDPMHIEEIAIDDKATQKQVALNLVMKNVDLLGLKNVKVNSITWVYIIRCCHQIIMCKMNSMLRFPQRQQLF